MKTTLGSENEIIITRIMNDIHSSMNGSEPEKFIDHLRELTKYTLDQDLDNNVVDIFGANILKELDSKK